MIKGTQIIDNQQQNITKMHKEINQRDTKMFELKIKGN